MKEWIQRSEEVEAAVRAGRPVVALESTVIAQGLPWPENLETARDLERTVRQAGAVPATFAVVDGVPRAGLDDATLQRIASDPHVGKLSARDLPVAVSRGATGATTVAATAFLASRSGIAVFATGGIGGVHRGVPPDISADLLEIARTPILIVTAGAKSILDLPTTREALEALGVLVLGWRTDRFPAFYVRASTLGVDHRVDSAAEVAGIWGAHRDSNAPGGILVCVPVPEDAAIPEAPFEAALQRALEGARIDRIAGKELTPYLLREIAEATGGATRVANRALLLANVSVAAELAVALAAAR